MRWRHSLTCNHRNMCNRMKGHKGPCIGSSGPCGCTSCTQKQRRTFADPCVYCNGAASTVDHIIPASNGGRGLHDNKAPACQKCNGEKGSLPLLRFLVLRAHAKAEGVPLRQSTLFQGYEGWKVRRIWMGLPQS